MTRKGVIQPVPHLLETTFSAPGRDYLHSKPINLGLPSRIAVVPLCPPLPGYVCGRRLGGGPTCNVYLATDGHGQTVVVKVLKSNAEQNPLAVELIRREALAGIAIAHPQIVRIIESQITRSPYYLVMEYVPGNTAKQQLLQYGSFTVSTTLGIIRQIAEGLACLHRAGFIHGDVKPSNIMLPSPGKAKLIDLGFAHRPGELKPWADRGHVIGTANYLAPELTKLPPDDTDAADLFSLGVTFFELLTGALPYPGRSTAEVIKKRSNCKPAQMPFSHKPAIRKLIESLTNPYPNQRPTAQQLVRELAGLQIMEMKQAA
jgi:serine/threonine protein kinase